MALVSINWSPDRKMLQQFSEYGMFFLGMVGAPWALLSGDNGLAVILWGLAIVGRIIGAVRPEALRIVYLVLSVVTWPIGWCFSHLIIATIYYLAFTPLGLFFRLIGRDALERRFDHEAGSYWVPHNPDQGLSRYLRQF